MFKGKFFPGVENLAVYGRMNNFVWQAHELSGISRLGTWTLQLNFLYKFTDLNAFYRQIVRSRVSNFFSVQNQSIVNP